jgi:hypothetical protein
LLNKIDWLHRHLQTDENNLSIIVAALAAFTSSATPTGWLKATSTDVGPIGGQIQLILQWGLIDLSPYANSSSQIVNISFNFPIAFPHATWALHAFWRYIGASPARLGLPLRVWSPRCCRRGTPCTLIWGRASSFRI